MPDLIIKSSDATEILSAVSCALTSPRLLAVTTTSSRTNASVCAETTWAPPPAAQSPATANAKLSFLLGIIGLLQNVSLRLVGYRHRFLCIHIKIALKKNG